MGSVKETGFLLQRAHRRLRQAHNEALRPMDMSIVHVAVLGLVATQGPMSQQKLIELLDVDKSTMVYIIDALEKQGLAERRSDPQDRRAHEIHLTPAGFTRLAEAGRIVKGVEDDFLKPLSAAAKKQFNALLQKL